MDNLPNKSRKYFHNRLEDFLSILREDIFTGQYKPGSYLPSELELGSQYSLSKNSIRKGLDQLVAEGLIEKIPRVGTRVLQPQGAGSVTLRFGYHSTNISEAKILEMIDAFQQHYPYIKIQSVSLPYDSKEYHHTVLEYIDNDMLDVMTMNVVNFNYFRENNQLHRLDTFESSSSIYPFLLQPYTIEDNLYVLPFIFSPVVLCYNLKHFQECGIPEPDSSWSWRTLIEAAKRLTIREGKQHRYGFYFTPLALNRWVVFLLQSGDNFKKDDQGKLQICRSNLMENLELCYNIIHNEGIFPHILAENLTDAETLFQLEKVSMIMTTYFQLNQLQDTSVSYDIAPLPYSHQSRTLLLSIGMAMNKASKSSEAARKFAEFSISYDRQAYIRDHTLSIPTVKQVAEQRAESVFHRPFRFNMHKEITSTYAHYTDLGLSQHTLNLLGAELKLYFSGLEAPDVFCQKIEDLIDQANLIDVTHE